MQELANEWWSTSGLLCAFAKLDLNSPSPAFELLPTALVHFASAPSSSQSQCHSKERWESYFNLFHPLWWSDCNEAMQPQKERAESIFINDVKSYVNEFVKELFS